MLAASSLSLFHYFKTKKAKKLLQYITLFFHKSQGNLLAAGGVTAVQRWDRLKCLLDELSRILEVRRGDGEMTPHLLPITVSFQ